MRLGWRQLALQGQDVLLRDDPALQSFGPSCNRRTTSEASHADRTERVVGSIGGDKFLQDRDRFENRRLTGSVWASQNHALAEVVEDERFEAPEVLQLESCNPHAIS